MSTKGIKRLTLRARQSMSGLNPFIDGSDFPEKENDAPNVEEFGALKKNTSPCHSVSPQVSPAKESPSRRKRLMGSLRSISGLRSMRTPPPKEKGKAEVECHVQRQEPYTPVRTTGPSLALNFKESPPDEPMFDVTQRESSPSSLAVHHSSPVTIPTPAPQRLCPCMEDTFSSDLPAGTVPDSPAPLQKALEREPFNCAGCYSEDPPDSEAETAAKALPTPMPGTNIGFSDYDLTGTAKHETGLAEASSYFDDSVGKESENFSPENTFHAVSYPAGSAILNKQSQNHLAGRATSILPKPNDMNADRSSNLTVHTRGSSNVVESNHHIVDYWRALDGDVDRALLLRPRVYDCGPKNERATAVDMKYVDHQSLHKPDTDRKIAKRNHTREGILIMQAQDNRQAHMIDMNHATPAQNVWGTHGSLYDGTGYGDATSSNSTRSSAQLITAGAPVNEKDSAAHSASSVSRDSAAVTPDHETLEEVIRAYAALEEEGASIVMADGTVGETAAKIESDIHPANKQADHSHEA